jgi:hypothetical protein
MKSSSKSRSARPLCMFKVALITLKCSVCVLHIEFSGPQSSGPLPTYNHGKLERQIYVIFIQYSFAFNACRKLLFSPLD